MAIPVDANTRNTPTFHQLRDAPGEHGGDQQLHRLPDFQRQGAASVDAAMRDNPDIYLDEATYARLIPGKDIPQADMRARMRTWTKFKTATTMIQRPAPGRRPLQEAVMSTRREFITGIGRCRYQRRGHGPWPGTRQTLAASTGWFMPDEGDRRAPSSLSAHRKPSGKTSPRMCRPRWAVSPAPLPVMPVTVFCRSGERSLAEEYCGTTTSPT
jgi:hypothetical protein